MRDAGRGDVFAGIAECLVVATVYGAAVSGALRQQDTLDYLGVSDPVVGGLLQRLSAADVSPGVTSWGSLAGDAERPLDWA